MERTTGYVEAGSARIAYQTAGRGPVDLVVAMGSFVSFETAHEDPAADVYYRRLESFTRLIRFDRRGAGSSDPSGLDGSFDREAYVDETLAVMDAVGAQRAAIMAGYDAGPMAIRLAVAHPERVKALILANTTARYPVASDYPIGLDRERVEVLIDTMTDTWGVDEQASAFIPSRAGDAAFRAQFAKMQRLTLTPTQAAAGLRAMVEDDVRPLLHSIRVPTLILHRAELEIIPFTHARYLAGNIAGARLAAIPGKDGPFVWENPDPALDAIEEFLTGVAPATRADRVIRTVLFTDVAGSTRHVRELGDRRWRGLLDLHDEFAARAVKGRDGTLVKRTGDGFMATFDRPGSAVHAAAEFEQAARGIGLEVRMGVHTGEIEVRGDDVGGLAVHLASRVMSLARPGEILASRTVKDVAAGGDLEFEDRGFHELKGLDGQWQLFSVTPSHRDARPAAKGPNDTVSSRTSRQP